MLQIGDILVSLELLERYFCCDLSACRGACCIEGDAGAPVTPDEEQRLREVLPEIRNDLTHKAQRIIDRQGVAYRDPEGELVTTIVDGRDCAFACRGADGTCLCAIDRAFRQGRVGWRKPFSCYLYPLRIKEFPTFTAINYHRWDICRPAEAHGRKLGIRLYQFVKEPLIERFGADWYAELCEVAEAYYAQYGSDS